MKDNDLLNYFGYKSRQIGEIKPLHPKWWFKDLIKTRNIITEGLIHIFMKKVKVINKSNNDLPRFESDKAAGSDLRASFKYITPDNPLKVFGDAEIVFAGETHKKTMLRLAPKARAIIPTDLYITVPDGHFCAIYPRSGLAIKKALGLANSVGVLDADYTGNMSIPVINNGFEDIWIEDGERIAQMIIQPYVQFEWEEVDSLEKTNRDPRGFGSSGTL